MIVIQYLRHIWQLKNASSYCLGYLPTGDNVEDLSQYGLGCSTGLKTPTFTLHTL